MAPSTMSQSATARIFWWCWTNPRLWACEIPPHPITATRTAPLPFTAPLAIREPPGEGLFPRSLTPAKRASKDRIGRLRRRGLDGLDLLQEVDDGLCPVPGRPRGLLRLLLLLQLPVH